MGWQFLFILFASLLRAEPTGSFHGSVFGPVVTCDEIAHETIAVDVAQKLVGPNATLTRLGGGSQGIVFESKYQGRRVVVKVAKVGSGEALQREYEVLQTVSDNHVVKVLRFSGEPSPAIMMEHAGERDLSQMIHSTLAVGTALEPTKVLSLTKQAAKGLEALHSVGMIHRDIKPENMMVNAEGHLTIVDCALCAPSGKPVKHAGTKDYLSPGQIHDAFHSNETLPSPSNDIYALCLSMESALLASSTHKSLEKVHEQHPEWFEATRLQGVYHLKSDVSVAKIYRFYKNKGEASLPVSEEVALQKLSVLLQMKDHWKSAAEFLRNLEP